MLGNDLKKLLKCPPTRDLDTHIKWLMEATEDSSREELALALSRLDGYEPRKPMTQEQRQAAATVYLNPQFTAFILDAMDNVRNSALMDGDSQFLKGQIVALDRTLRHFLNCYNSTKNPGNNGDNKG